MPRSSQLLTQHMASLVARHLSRTCPHQQGPPSQWPDILSGIRAVWAGQAMLSQFVPSPACSQLLPASICQQGHVRLYCHQHVITKPAAIAAHAAPLRPAVSTMHYSTSSTPPTTAPGHSINWPNAISIARAISGPPIAFLILQEQWPWAFAATAISGWSDWLDGYLARKLKQQSVLGSYLDPLGDKALVCCVVGALAYKSMIPGWVAVIVIGRDVALVSGMALHRFKMLGWRFTSMEEFFQTQAPQQQQQQLGQHQLGSAEVGNNPPSGVPMMQPLMVSKLNTVFQLLLVGGCISQQWQQWPGPEVLQTLEVLTATTTVLSCSAYAYKYASGKLLG